MKKILYILLFFSCSIFGQHQTMLLVSQEQFSNEIFIPTPISRLNSGDALAVTATDGFIDWESNGAVSAGGGDQDDSGLLWTMILGNYYRGGASKTWDVSALLAKGYNETDVQELYDSEIYGNGTQYTFTLPNGDYNINLFFGEGFHASAGNRVFDIVVNNVVIESNFDSYVYTGGALKGDSYVIPHTVVNDTPLAIRLDATTDNAQINGIEIISASATETIDPPTSFTASNITSTTVDLSWTAPSGSPTDYKIYNSDVLIATVGSAATSYTLEGLTSETSYVLTTRSIKSSAESTNSNSQSFSTLANGSSDAVVTGDDMQYHKTTLTWDALSLSESPATYLDYRMNVTITAPSNEVFIVPGYFAADGDAAETSATSGNKWRVHFTPKEIGDYDYSVSFRTGTDIAASISPTDGAATSIDGNSGTFTIAATNKTGDDFRAKGKLQYNGTDTAQFDDGSYYFEVGADSPETFLEYADFDATTARHDYSEVAGNYVGGDPSWQSGKGTEIIGAVNYLANQGMNVHYFLTMNITGDGGRAYPFPNTTDYTTYDVSKLDQWQIVFDHMYNKGIAPELVLTETENSNWFEVQEGIAITNFSDSRKVYYREMVARFGYLNIIYDIGEEANWDSGGDQYTAAQIDEAASYIQSLSPYNDLISVHNGPSTDVTLFPALTALSGNTSINTISFQGNYQTFTHGHDAIETVKDLATTDSKEWVVRYTEPYASSLPNIDTWTENALWASITAGGAGIHYYSYNGDIGTDDYTTYASYYSRMKIAKDFMYDYTIPFWEMENNDANVSSETMLSKPSDSHIIFLPDGGTVNANLGVSGTYTIKWFDPRNGGGLQDGSVTSIVADNTQKSIGTAPSSTTQSWVVYSYIGASVPVTGIDITSITPSVNEGSTLQLTTDFAPSNATNQTVTWTSSNTGIFTISNTGVVTGVAEGSATATVTTNDGSFTDNVSVGVTAIAGTTVTSTADLQSDNAEEFNSNGNSFITSIDLELNSDNTNGNQWAASIFDGLNIPAGSTITDASIQFTCYTATSGDAPITIYGHLGNKTAFAATPNQISSLTQTTANVSWTIPTWVATNDALSAQKTPDLTSIIQEIVDDVGYSSTDNITLIYDSDEVNQIVKYAYNENSDALKCPVLSVTYGGASANVPVTGITITSSSPTLAENGSLQLATLFAPTDATDKTVTWASSNTGIFTISNTGVVTGVAVGTATATVTTNDGSFTDNVSVQVTAAAAFDYEETGGAITIQVEDLTLPTDWNVETATAGYIGAGYINWTGGEFFTVPGTGTISTTIQINTTGIYKFTWRTAIGNGAGATDNNDTWVRFNDATEYYATDSGTGSGGSKIYPIGSGQTPNPAGAGADNWFKVYTNSVAWSTQTRTSDNDPHDIYVQFDTAGVYTMEISARSEHHLIDSITLDSN